jgi:hypothetical protein
VPYRAAVQVPVLGSSEHVALAGEEDAICIGFVCHRFNILIGFAEDANDDLQLIGGDLKSRYVRPCSISFWAFIRGEDAESER